jgi:hypothetical protein
MIQLLKYSDTIGPYFFMVLVIAIAASAVWLIAELKRTSMAKNDWFVKRTGGSYKKMMIN